MSIANLPFAERLWWATAILLAILFLLTWPLSYFDKRLIDGIGIWAKPMKFQLSLALHVVTLALAVSTMSVQWQRAQLTAVVSIACNIAIYVEIAYIMIQASRGQASHFNLSTPFYAAIYKLMAVGAIVLTCSAAVVGIIVVVDQVSPTDIALRHGIIIGLVGGTVLTLVVALTMGARMSHNIGVEPAGSVSMPFTGWSLTIGDLRVPHFFATHMMQAVPLAGLVFNKFLPSSIAIAAVWMFAAFWSAMTLYFYDHALKGLPFQAL